MNQVSWRRILQRAGSDFPGEGGGAVIKMQDRAPERRGPPPGRPQAARAPQGGDLESELKRALDRAARQQRDVPPAAPPPGWDPIFIAEEPRSPSPKPSPGRPPAVPSRVRPLPAPQAPALTKRASTGARNVIAISLSVAVIGLAIQQIGTQWNQSHGDGSSDGVDAAPPARATAMLHSGGPADKFEQSRLGADSDPILDDLPVPKPTRAPARAPQSDTDRDAFFQEMEEAAKIFQAKQASKEASRPAPATPVVAHESGAIGAGEEQSMLRRGRELMERGHVNGARMIFEHLAAQQSALGAFAMAQSYDRKFLLSIGVAGLEPDSKLAAEWYQRAAELSSQAVASR